MQFPNYVDLLRPESRRYALIFDLMTVLAGSILLALASQISVRLPFSPVPITAQTLAVLLIGAAFGSKRAVLAILAYLAEGAAGLPVFAGGLSGIAYIAGPTGGYLVGFIASAYIVGLCIERGYGRNLPGSYAAMLAGNSMIYIFGLLWLAFYIDKNQVLQMGLFPFLVGDILKIIIASFTLPAAWSLIKRQ